MWSFGVVLYEMITGVKMFLSDTNGNIVDNSALIDLYLFTRSFKHEYLLSRVDNYDAKNLLSQLLMKDPSKRVKAGHALRHPFYTRETVTRMIGEEAKYDVFISYRVTSDTEHAEIMYNKLTAMGLKVWWDKKCLELGEPWEIGFCDGLISSRVFMPILSREAVNHPTKSNQSFGALTSSSSCDNVLLEHWLALEFRERGFTERIFPILVGDVHTQRSSSSKTESLVYGDYFADNCSPKFSDHAVVASVASRLSEQVQRLCFDVPRLLSLSVSEIYEGIMKYQGVCVVGLKEEAFEYAVSSMIRMVFPLHDCNTHSPAAGSGKTLMKTMEEVSN
jgi:serine/threonine protein kinase